MVVNGLLRGLGADEVWQGKCRGKDGDKGEGGNWDGWGGKGEWIAGTVMGHGANRYGVAVQ